MNRRIEALARLADLIREAELSHLARASAARDAVQLDLTAHDAAMPHGEITDARSKARHDTWRAVKRASLNIALARETAQWLEARDAAARAVGRADVLKKLAKLPPGPRRPG